MQVFGHRGSRVPGPENTVAAVTDARRAGADGVEIDVRRAAGGQLVCVHDPLLRGNAVLRTPAAVLARSAVPSVPQILDAGSGGLVILEIKNRRRQPDYDGRSAATAVSLLGLLADRRRAGAADRVVISSFDPHSLQVAADGGHRTGLLTIPQVPISAGLRVALRGGQSELHAHVSALPVWPPRRASGAVARARDAGIALVVWTVTDTDEALRLRDLGVDAVICDDPAAVVAALASGR